ncbi:MAG: hypothetical protein GXP28_09375 [Planctomycetes bacterium]|nr:hypothetical protein [Planctomycetota bacterium]
MTIARRGAFVATVLACGILAGPAPAQEVKYETGADGVRYQVTTRVVKRQVPVTVMQDRQQTTYAQQITTNHLSHQQLYNVPVTQYQWQSQLRGRWNPFMTPYWTHNLKPVTTWHQQVANVQIPVSSAAWVPQTKTVQVPVTQYRTAEETVTTRVAMNEPRHLGSTQLGSTGSTATIAARPSTVLIGGRQLENDPPRQATGLWQSPSDSRYR